MATEKRLIDVNDVLLGIATFKECYEGVGLKPWIVEQIQTALQMVERFVKETPAVDAVEVVHGRWENSHGIYSCSVCGKSNPYEVLGDNIWYWPCNYCPNCGEEFDRAQV